MTAMNRNLIAFAALVGGWLGAHPAFSQTTTYYDAYGNVIGSSSTFSPPQINFPRNPYDPTQNQGSTYDRPKVRIPAGPYQGGPSYIPGY